MKTLIYTAFAVALTGQANFAEAKTSESSTEQAYISIGVDALKQLKKNHGLSIDVSPVKSIQPVGSAFQTVSIPASQIDQLSNILHEDFNRCPGYFRHDSLQKAVAFNQREAQSKKQKVIDYTIDNSDTVYSMLGKVSGENMTETVDALAAYNNRYYRSNSGKESALWIKQKWETIAQGRDDFGYRDHHRHHDT
jgi:leucyl aminopeptidase